MSKHGFQLKGKGYQFHNTRKRKKWRVREVPRRAKKRRTALVLNATDSEIVLRGELVKSGIDFDFQRLICDRRNGKHRIADFYFPRGYGKCALIVEVDGAYHLTLKQQGRDGDRTEWIRKLIGAEVARFTDAEVMTNPAAVVAKIVSLGAILKTYHQTPTDADPVYVAERDWHTP